MTQPKTVTLYTVYRASDGLISLCEAEADNKPKTYRLGGYLWPFDFKKTVAKDEVNAECSKICLTPEGAVRWFEKKEQKDIEYLRERLRKAEIEFVDAVDFINKFHSREKQ